MILYNVAVKITVTRNSYRVMKMLEYRIMSISSGGNSIRNTAFPFGKQRRGRLRAFREFRDRRAKIERLTELLNDEQVEPCHFEDIIEDYSYRFSSLKNAKMCYTYGGDENDLQFMSRNAARCAPSTPAEAAFAEWALCRWWRVSPLISARNRA